jgi:chitinase
MLRQRICVLAVALTAMPASLAVGAAAADPNGDGKVIAAYAYPQNGPLVPGQIDPMRLTRINYAFAAIQNGRLVLTSETDKTNLAFLTSLRKQNSSLTVLLSVGGWNGSAGFSDVAHTVESRRVFIDSAMEIMKLCDLDGLDVDWEYPGLSGAGNPFRKEDKRNFTLLLKELRGRFTRQSTATNRRLYVTIAAGASGEYLDHTEMAQVQRFVDAVNLMSYDYYEAGSDALTGNHAPLFTDPADPKKESADDSVRAFELAGVPAEKIVLGVPFYGRMWQLVPNINHGLFQPGKPIPNSYAPYSTIQQTMLGHGFTRFWDPLSMVPSLYNEEKQIFVSYEDPESLAAKCSYVLSRRLGGIMFWSYFNDSSGELLFTIDRGLHGAR